MKINNTYKTLLNKKYDIDRAIYILEHNKSDIMDLSVDNFHNIMKNFSTQKRSPYYEKYLIELFNMKKVLATENRGDAIDNNGKYYEYKISFKNEANKLNIRQIRLYQDIDYYLCVYFGDKNEDRYVFILTKKEIQKEIEKQKNQYTHGVKDINKDNKYNEFSLTISLKSELFKVWVNKYLNTELTKLVRA